MQCGSPSIVAVLVRGYGVVIKLAEKRGCRRELVCPGERKKSEAGACLSFPERWGPCRDVPDRGDGQKDKAAGGKPFWLCTKNVKSHCVRDADGRLILHACSRLFECGRYAMVGRAA